MDKSLSNLEIQAVLGSKCVIMSYKNINKINNIDKFFKRNKYLIILYEWKKNYGHWTCILKQGKTLEFFDSYGTQPDMELKDFSKYTRNQYGMEFPLVAKLLMDSNKEIHYNNYKLQSQKQGVNTCGRWCIYRCLNDHLNIDQFVHKLIYRYKIKPDKLIVQATNRLLKSKV